MKHGRLLVAAVAAACATLVAGTAAADPGNATVTSSATNDTSGRGGERVPTNDPTGGAYTSPTLLFTPAAALPVWNVRVTALSEFQTPADTAANPAPDSGIRPGAIVEVGLPAGFTLAAGTNWVGGDVNPDTGAKDFNLGLSPFFQARYHLYGDKSGQGFQLGTSFTYKFVGFEGDPGEGEFALSSQYRTLHWEAGLQGVLGKDFATTDADGELKVYGLYRVIPQLGLGVAGQVRGGLVINPGDTTYDVIGGGIASLTIDRYQVGGLIGASSLGLATQSATSNYQNVAHFGTLGQLFGSVRF
jgi:hypothetical protein